MFTATKPDDVPDQKHFVILEFRSIHIPGDKRSIQSPGHGYGAHSEHSTDYRYTFDQDEWHDEIKKLEVRQSQFAAIRASGRATVELTPVVTIVEDLE